MNPTDLIYKAFISVFAFLIFLSGYSLWFSRSENIPFKDSFISNLPVGIFWFLIFVASRYIFSKF